MSRLKNLFLKAGIGIFSAGTTVLIAACYGPVKEEQHLARGYVKDSENQKGISGITVCYRKQGKDRLCANTHTDGAFSIIKRTILKKEMEEFRSGDFEICAGHRQDKLSTNWKLECYSFKEGTKLPVFLNIILGKKPEKK